MLKLVYKYQAAHYEDPVYNTTLVDRMQEKHQIEMVTQKVADIHEDIKLEKNKEAISNLIYKAFDDIYCDNCRYDDTDNFYYHCEDCHRKAMNWSVARSACDDLAEMIICELYSEDLW